MNRPMVFEAPEAIVFWIVYLWAFAPEMRILNKALNTKSKETDAGTARLIAWAGFVAQLTGFAASFLNWFLFPWPHVALYAGICLLLAGSLLRRYCFRTLGQYFTGAVHVSTDQPVIDRGPYRWVRHPAYTGGLIMFLGIGVALGSCVSVSVLVLLPGLAYVRRVQAEEKALLGVIGEPYRSYMERTKRFVPFIV